MDVELEEMQFLGIYGVFRETSKLIYSWRKIFSQITLALILPLSFLYLAHMEISHLFLRKLIHDEIILHHTQINTPRFEKLSDLVSSDKVYFWLFQAAYTIFAVAFSLLSTSAVVYTVASIYTARDVTFKHVMSVVPRVWKRLLITFLCVFVSIFAFTFLTFCVFTSIMVIVFFIRGPYGFGIGIEILFLFFKISFALGLFYLTIIWQLSSAVSVLEDLCGFKAMAKSKLLIKGKMITAAVILVLISLPSVVIRFLFGHVVVHHTASLGFLSRGILGIVCFLFLFFFFLVKLVTEAVLYFVCKSYHHENIDKSALSDHLQVYLLGEYVPLKAKDVQLEKLQV